MDVLWTLFVLCCGVWCGWQLWRLIDRSVPESKEKGDETDTWD